MLVYDPDCDKPQHLQPEEAELLHGLQAGCTAGHDATNKQRLEAIGRGWDVNITNMLLSSCKLTNNESPQEIIMLLHKTLPPDELAACLMLMDKESRDWYLSVITSNHSSTHLCQQPNADYHNAGLSAKMQSFSHKLDMQMHILP